MYIYGRGEHTTCWLDHNLQEANKCVLKSDTDFSLYKKFSVCSVGLADIFEVSDDEALVEWLPNMCLRPTVKALIAFLKSLEHVHESGYCYRPSLEPLRVRENELVDVHIRCVQKELDISAWRCFLFPIVVCNLPNKPKFYAYSSMPSIWQNFYKASNTTKSKLILNLAVELLLQAEDSQESIKVVSVPPLESDCSSGLVCKTFVLDGSKLPPPPADVLKKLTVLNRHIKGDSILDFYCHEGYLSFYYASKGFRVFGVEKKAEFINKLVCWRRDNNRVLLWPGLDFQQPFPYRAAMKDPEAVKLLLCGKKPLVFTNNTYDNILFLNKEGRSTTDVMKKNYFDLFVLLDESNKLLNKRGKLFVEVGEGETLPIAEKRGFIKQKIANCDGEEMWMFTKVRDKAEHLY